MLLDDLCWQTLCGGYGTPYDASIALRALQDGNDAWDELQSELHHQGDVGIASYAAIPHLVRIAGAMPIRDWHFYGLVAIIDVARHRKGNPALPAWLTIAYQRALANASTLALADLKLDTDSISTCVMLSVVALAKGDVKLGALLADLDEDELDALLEDRSGWSGLYK